ncbi:MAG: cytidylate kinase-like family protein [Ignavibacteriaceae bacterium]|nr:cytidylate kinase-like family protein [Ignavibacteriaceae bacterium]
MEGRCMMLALGSYEKCKQYINLHSLDSDTKKEIFPCITISRQTGSGSYEVSEILIDILQRRTKEPENPWTYFNKELINKVLAEFKLPKAFSNYLSEDKYSHISDAVNELLGVKPSDWTIINKTTEVILQLAHYGKTIIVGRGSTVITAKLPNCINVRLIAPLENRIKHVQDIFSFSRMEAMDYIKREDESRRKHLKSHFFRELDDPTLYHLIINTGKNSYAESAEIIADTVIKRFPKSFIY